MKKIIALFFLLCIIFSTNIALAEEPDWDSLSDLECLVRKVVRTNENMTLEELKNTWMAKLEDNCIFISAREKQNIDTLKDIIYKRVCELHVQKYPYNDFLYQTYDEEEQ